MTVPEFPIFKKISQIDPANIGVYTTPLIPFSTYNTTNLIAWDLYEDRALSVLNGNLIIRMSSYHAREPFYSLAGSNKPLSTIQQLRERASEAKEPTALKYVPHNVAMQVQDCDFLRVIFDRDNSEYIYSVSSLANLSGHPLKAKRMMTNRFLRQNPYASVVVGRSLFEIEKEEVLALFDEWAEHREMLSSDEIRRERTALSRTLTGPMIDRLMFSGVYVNRHLIAFSIDEITHRHYCIGHFIKSGLSHAGVSEYLNTMIARHLRQKGVWFWNWQQDLGSSGLRQLKRSYQPRRFLKKYTIL